MNFTIPEVWFAFCHHRQFRVNIHKQQQVQTKLQSNEVLTNNVTAEHSTAQLRIRGGTTALH